MLAVTGGKGGVVKTTTAFGLAAAMARGSNGRAVNEEAPDVLVVDADRDLPNLARTAGVGGRRPGFVESRSSSPGSGPTERSPAPPASAC